MKLQSVPPHPVSQYAHGVPTNLVLNRTPEGEWQIARGTGADGDYELLFQSNSLADCQEFLKAQIEMDYPGLQSQHD